MCNTSPSGRDFDVLEKSLDIESSIFFTIRTDVDKTCYSCFFLIVKSKISNIYVSDSYHPNVCKV
jgi:hypothetical protein